ncbi:MAG: HAMP domain-containing histidine kinase [Candidatus Latescibacteria bacterium]|nr:HAMP domain-containing histidine kinase [Candidatus Latescibacterota bacterium]
MAKIHEFAIIVFSDIRQELFKNRETEFVAAFEDTVLIERAVSILNSIDIYAYSQEEEILIDAIEKSFLDVRYAAMSQNPVTVAYMNTLFNNLIGQVERYQVYNTRQIKKIEDMSQFIRRRVHNGLVGMLVFVCIIILVGSITLIRRVVRPTIKLSEATERFGNGDLTSRVREYDNDDEMGKLCESFNAMAEDIANRETARLEFVGGVVHDIKNPLSIVGSAVKMLKKKSNNRSLVEEWLDRIYQEVHRLENMTHDLMDQIQVETGRLSLNLAEIDLVELVETINKVEGSMIASHHISLAENGPCIVLADKHKIERVVLNFLTNAIKYSPHGTTIILSVETNENLAKVSITDQGIGISKNELDRLFKPFLRLKNSHRMADGNGFGLYTAKKIIEAHKGTIHIDSQEGVGTTVIITLPLIGTS